MTTPETLLSEEEFQAQYGLEPTTIENLKATQPGWEKTLGRKVSLEEVYFLEFDQPGQAETEE